jgi:hypothetical protein
MYVYGPSTATISDVLCLPLWLPSGGNFVFFIDKLQVQSRYGNIHELHFVVSVFVRIDHCFPKSRRVVTK